MVVMESVSGNLTSFWVPDCPPSFAPPLAAPPHAASRPAPAAVTAPAASSRRLVIASPIPSMAGMVAAAGERQSEERVGARGQVEAVAEPWRSGRGAGDVRG